MIFILAGNYREAQDCARQMNLRPSDWHSIDCSHSVIGYHDITVVRYGTWFYRKDYKLISDYLLTCGIKKLIDFPYTPTGGTQTQTMAKAQLFWDSSIQAYRLKMHAEWHKVEKIVEFLKQQIPHSDRELMVQVDPKTQKKDYTWTFTEKYFDGTVKFLELVFGKPEIAIITKQQVEAAQQPRTHIVPNGGNPLFAACYEFLKAIPFESAQKAYRDAALRLHPDRGGSMDKMASVNALWTKLEKELYQQ